MDGQIDMTLAHSAKKTAHLGACGDVFPARPGLRMRAKRLGDAVCACLALLATAPLLAVLALAIKLEDGGPVLYRHARKGRNGQTFTLLKFRTMHTDAESRLDALLASDPAIREDWDMHHKLRNDPRITPVGRWLRRSSLDELPQLLNIIRGDMSLVGPRPITDEELNRYGSAILAYEAVRPGLTGLWQVSGRNETDFTTRIALDRQYVERWSLRRDIGILLRTVPAVLFARGAY
ncbi:MAG: sugar transferase [Parvularcula sp.]